MKFTDLGIHLILGSINNTWVEHIYDCIPSITLQCTKNHKPTHLKITCGFWGLITLKTHQHHCCCCAEHLRYCSVRHQVLNVLTHPPVAHWVAKDDVVISTKGWVCIPLPEDIICTLLCRQQEKGEWWQRKAGKLLFLTPYQLDAPYRFHSLLSQTITRVALFTQLRHSISLPHPLSLLALNAGDPQQQTQQQGNADELTHINRSKQALF